MQMFTNRVFNPSALQVATGNLPCIPDGLACILIDDTFQISYDAYLPNEPAAANCCYFIYDSVRQHVIYSAIHNMSGIMWHDFDVEIPAGFGTPNGSQLSNCRLYAFISGVAGNGNSVITNTFSCPIEEAEE